MFEYNLFNRLPSWSQVAVLAKAGTPVATRQHQDWEITLYALNNYFVERWTKQNLEIVTSFKNSAAPLQILEPYLHNLDWEDYLPE